MKIGRFEVVDRLGAGAMGVVYAARDPHLDREVALKVLRKEHRDGPAAARLLREAKALARLRHPHVVTVLEIGTYEDGLFIAMDRINGPTLREWLRAPRSWRAVLEIFVQAAEALQAAHEAGLVHRDFKPDNVLVDAQGRAKVVDFGLARDGDEVSSTGRPHLDTQTDEASQELTRTGALVGTPAYMAPEAFEGRTDARSDQFSYCASLYEALYGMRPFNGKSVARMLEAVESGNLERPTRDVGAPSWLRRIVVRGLAADPDRRFENMASLLAAIERHRRRRVRLVVGGAALGGLVAGALAVSASTGAIDDRCRFAADTLGEIWNDARRGELREAFRSTGIAYAEDTWARVESELREWNDAWATMRIDSCRATSHGAQSDSLHDLRMACLDRDLQTMAALLDLFEEADETVVSGAVEAARALPDLSVCANEARLRASDARKPTTELTERAEALEAQLAVARMRMHAGQWGAALVEAEASASEASELGLSAVAGAAYLLMTELQEKLDDLDSAVSSAKQAIWAADEAHDDEVRAQASIWLATLYGKLHDFAMGQDWVRSGRALVSRLGAPARLEAMLADHEATLLHYAGQLGASVRRRREALALRTEFLPWDDLTLAATHHDLATTLGELGHLDEAIASLEHVLEIRTAALGENHPSVAKTLNGIAGLWTDLGRFEEATEHLHRALDIGTRSLGPEHPFVGTVHVNLANVAAQGTNPEASIPDYERAIRIFEINDPNDVRLADALGNYGRVLWGMGRYPEALVVLERALVLEERVRGAEHVALMYVLNTLGQTLTALERYDEARASLERGLAVATAELGEEHVMVALLLFSLAEAHLASGQPTRAVPVLERALVIHERITTRPGLRGQVAFALAGALWSTGERRRAVSLARSAYEDFARDRDQEPRMREVEQWLEARGESIVEAQSDR